MLHPTRRFTLALSLVTATLAAIAPSSARPALAQPPTPTLVQPESLDAGFIIVLTDRTQKATAESPIYVASNHNGWNPGDPGSVLTRRSDMRWTIQLPKPKLDSKMEFKFTRGSWEVEELKDDFSVPGNRMLPLVDASKLKLGEAAVIEVVVEHWRDELGADPARLPLSPYREVKVGAGSIKRLEVTGGGRPAVRDLIIWLPPGYDEPANADKTYPVLYLQDGQNLFEKIPKIPAEWRADETAGELIKTGQIEPLIIVGIPSIDKARMSEYVPIPMFDGVEPSGDRYVEFLVGEVKPRVDRAFRVKAGPENTAVGGASLGGVISLAAATKHPQVFGKVLAESTPLLSKDRAGFKYFAAVTTWPKRIYFGMGGKEAGDDPKNADLNAQYTASAKEFDALLKSKGMPDADHLLVIDEKAVHNEEAWAKRLPQALKFLFPPK